MRFPNVTKLATRYLLQATGTRAVTTLPANLEASLPLYRVSRGPGGDDFISDSPLVDIEGFTATAGPNAGDRAHDLAEDAREAMHALAGMTFEGALVDSVRTVQGPVDLPYDNPAVTRTVASYRLTLRKR